MKCEDMEEVLEAYADGEASARERLEVAGHLDACAGCRKNLRWISATKAVARGVPAPSMPEGLKRNLLAAAAAARGRGRASGWLDFAREIWATRPWQVGTAAAFAAAAVVVAMRLAPLPVEELPLDAVLAAHNEYSRTMALSSQEQILSDLPERMGAEAVEHEL